MNLLIFLFICCAIICFYFGKNEKRYFKMVKENGEEFANKSRKSLVNSGYGLIIISLIYIIYKIL